MQSISLVLIIAFFIACPLCEASYDRYSYPPINVGPEAFEDKELWRRIGDSEILSAFQRPINWGWAKNVIIMVSDGMDANTVTASRIHKESERGKLRFEQFPSMALLKTYSSNKKVPDSAAAATAMFTGVKTNNEVLGVDSRVRVEDCMASLSIHSRIPSIMQWAQEAGKNTGFVTNKRVTEAIPAALYAHSASKHWECDNIPEDKRMCKDIARQLMEEEPGRNFKVIFGGGRQTLESNTPNSIYDRLDLFVCQRNDGRNLIEHWYQDKHDKGRSVVVQNTAELMEIDTAKTDYALGLFSNSYLPFDNTRDRSLKGAPSLGIMVEPAIKILHKYRHHGFVLLVHNGLVDRAHHEGTAKKAIEETIEFEQVVIKTLDTLYELGIENETLVIVTSAHAHTLSINGYPDRNASIFGIADRSKHDGIPYTTLTYATGSTLNFQYHRSDNHVVRRDPAREDLNSSEYHQQAAILTDRETHGGADVPVYAIGPHSHMFYGVHEQTYVAYVIAYAAKIGPYRINSAVKCAPTVLAFLCSMLAFVGRNMF